MVNSNVTSILASFATMKSLFDARSYQNPYQLLAEFISYIIASNKLHSFTAVEMKNRIKAEFGFEIPEAVVKTSLRSLDFVSSINSQFNVDSSKLNSDTVFTEKRLEAENINTDIIDLLKAFVIEKEPSNAICLDDLTEEFVAFLIDVEPKPDSKYTELISQFILKNEGDNKIQEALSAIREGSILYIGLNYNINETGSIRKPLTLYLGTEVLFSIYGYNGEIYKRLALDLYELVKNANRSDRRISLRYFSETKKEMDDFFASAESIVDGESILNDTVAMKSIINGCDTVGDVKVKASDFYHNLQYVYGIKEDDKTDFYSDEFDSYNLESLDTDKSLFDSVRFISHINKLRKGHVFTSNIDAEYLYVSNSRNTITVSKEQSEQDKQRLSLDYTSDYAISVEKITNLLWYKLGNGFGRKEYPSNVNVVLKARTLLASNISQNISKLYTETRSRFKSGEITETQLAARIVALRGKSILPEDLDADTIEESMDSSPEFLSRFEEEVLSNKTALEEKNKIIQTLENSNKQMIEERDTVIAQKDQLLLEKTEQNKNLEAELEKYHQQDEKKAEKKENVKKVFRLILSILWKALIVVVVSGLAILICHKINNEITSTVCSVIDIIGFIVIVWTTIKHDIRRYFPKDK